MWELTAKQYLQMECLLKYGTKHVGPHANPRHYMAFDPGEGTGWATFAEDGCPTDFGNVYDDIKGITDLLIENIGFQDGVNTPKVIIYEKWKLLKPKAFYGSTLLSSQVVGIIRGYGHLVRAEMHSNETNVNSTAQKWSGIKPEGSHSTQHWVMAFNHGWYYLQRQKKVNPRVLWEEPGVV